MQRLVKLRRLRLSRPLYALAGAALVIAGIASLTLALAAILAGLLLIDLAIEVGP